MAASCGTMCWPARAARPCRQRPAAVRCTATTPPSPKNALLVGVVETLFKFPPFFSVAAANARSMIIKRGERMGVDFAAEIQALKGVDWEAELAAVRDPSLQLPSYYTQPFHAYPQGNLSWEAALEVSAAAKLVHAAVMDPEGKRLDPGGDTALRDAYSARMQQLLDAQGCVRPVRDILDVGAATGLSSLALMRAFPQAHVTGVDLSPYFVAVGRHLQRQREQQQGAPEALSLLHAAAEDTRLPDASFDLVSMCLVCHELPESTTNDIFEEAYRLLRPGGALAVMEMNPETEAFQRILSNPFPYVAFKSTEPWLLEYIALDMPAAMEAAGFQRPQQLGNSPRHKTVVALKA